MRNGGQFIESIQDARCIYLDGERVQRVNEHPAFRGICRTIAGLYDFAAAPDSGMTFDSPETGAKANKVFMIPRKAEDLRTRHEAIEKWARRTYGLVGRGPEHVGSFLAGFASAPEVFARGRAVFGDNVTRFYKKLLTEDLYVSYVIIPPQIDRSKTAQGQDQEFMQVGVVKEKDGGIVVRGAQMLGTAAAISNYLFVSCIVPLQAGDETYALSFVVPVAAEGLKLYPRTPYALGKAGEFDYPLSTRFDETDALVVFDDVFVPWQNVFVYRDVGLMRAQFFETAAHVLGNNQAQIRLATKLKFLIGLARKIAATNRTEHIPQVQERLGELASLAAVVEGVVLGSEANPIADRFGVVRPNPRYLYGAMGLQAEIYPRALSILRELAGGGPLQVPSSFKDSLSPDTRADIKRYVRSTGVSSEERLKLFRLAWDFFGSEFGGRHHQYEMFYAGAPFVAKGYAYRNYGYEEAVSLVDELLASYGLPKP